jgi:hypothetical protein
VSFGIANNIDFEQQMSNFVSGMDLYDFSINSLPQKIKNSRWGNQSRTAMFFFRISRI